MAKSYSHTWGQKIGEVLEGAILLLLSGFAEKHGLYLDQKGERPARTGKKASWKDVNGNTHDLDYVLEKGGTPNKIGRPVAFIETAWRRYTKHSKNKAQEIQGAIMPLVEAHGNAPFIGAILAGEFTANARTQLQSLGFSVLFFPYEEIVKAFERFGISAAFEETTKEGIFKQKLVAWNRLSAADREKVSQAILDIHDEDVENFLAKLELSVMRTIENVIVMPLHGAGNTLGSVEAAMEFIAGYPETPMILPFSSYLVQVLYNNSDKIEGRFTSKEKALEFLRSYLPPPITPATSK